VLDGGVRKRRRAPRRVKIVLADQHAGAGVSQDLGELALAPHRVARHDRRTALPRRQHGDDRLRDVLQAHRDAIAGLGAALLQGHRQAVRQDVDLIDAERAIEVVDQRLVAVLCRRRTNISSAVLLAGSSAPDARGRGRAIGGADCSASLLSPSFQRIHGRELSLSNGSDRSCRSDLAR
jgi:hypothetical protein